MDRTGSDRTGLALSSFDMFHVGHLSALRQARAEVDRLVIAVASDELVRERVGRSPKVAEDERVEVLTAFFPDETIEVVSVDDADTLTALFGAEVELVCLPEGTDPPPGATRLRYEMTTSPSLRETLEPEILWALRR